MKLYRKIAFAMGLLFFSGCTMKTVRNQALWYKVSVPKDWKVTSQGLVSPSQDLLTIVRLPDHGPIRELVTSTQLSIQRGMAGFHSEKESFQSFRGHCAWKLMGTYRPKQNGTDYLLVRMIIDTNQIKTDNCEVSYSPGKYKYIITLKTYSSDYNLHRERFSQILDSFIFSIPKY